MKAKDLDLRDLLSFEPQGGVIRFGKERAIILDAVALGLLRKELIETLGISAARGILTRLGYAHGWRTAENMRTDFPWESDWEWQWAGGRLHTLHGMVVLESSERTEESPFAQTIWHNSYEAEQHLLHLGGSENPVCWTLTGFASGYLSFCHGREVYCVEGHCRGKGDTHCTLLGRFKEDWGPDLEPELNFYKKESVELALRDVTEALKKTEARLRARKRELTRLAGLAEDGTGIIARSASMRKVIELARRVAKVESTAVITGESGVGKERVVRLIHDESARADRPFVAVNCGAMTETLLESELFGHAKGAFTGADRERAGLFETASGGTLFLDEVGELSPSTQVKLLRVLQEKEVRRVGEDRQRMIDVRVLAATNNDLADKVAAGLFRQDLYYRLMVIEIHIAPLRERREDILPLARYFLSEMAKRMGKKVTGFSAATVDMLVKARWSGNVRELQNAIEHAVALSGSPQIEPDDLPSVRRLSAISTVIDEIRPLSDVERDYILSAIEAADGNKARAAAQLKMGVSTLFRKLKEYGVKS